MNHNKCYISHGVVDECYALDKGYCKLFDVNHRSDYESLPNQVPSSKTKESLPVNLRHDIIHNIFNDLWSVVDPFIQPLIVKMTKDFISPAFNREGRKNSILETRETPDDEDVLSCLLSAMTIRPVPLQKRESSARNRSDQNSISDDSIVLNIIHNKSQRPATARPNLMNHHPSGKTWSIQSNLSKPFSLSWKRNAAGMRLLPLSTQNLAGVTDTQINSRGLKQALERSSQSQSISKKLPPIKQNEEPNLLKVSYNSYSLG